MKNIVSKVMLLAVLAGALAPVSHAADAPLPRRDLVVELRQVKEGGDADAKDAQTAGQRYTVGNEDNSVWEPQGVLVRNGEKALLRLNDALPMQWTQSVGTQGVSNGTGTGSGASGGGGGSDVQAGVSNALVWFDAGQSLSVQAKWPGGSKPVLLVLEVQRAAVEPRRGADLPPQSRNSVSTTVTVPLASWVTIAATGKAAKAGVYSSESGVLGRRLLQVRVMAP